LWGEREQARNESAMANNDVRPMWCFTELLEQAEALMMNQTALVAVDEDPLDPQWANLCWFVSPIANTVAA